MNTPDAKKPAVLNTFKIKYNLISAVETTSADENGQGENPIVEFEKQGPNGTEKAKLLQVRRITIITPEYSEPITNQEIKISSKIKSMGLMGSGTCSYLCKFEKDVLYPGEIIKLSIDVDNSGCSKKIEKYKIKLIKRTLAFNIQNSKPIYQNDQILVADKIEAKCGAKEKDTQNFEFKIPNSLFISKEEEEKFKIPLIEKPLSFGPASSIAARLFKVNYVLQFSLKHHIMGATSKTMPEA